MKKHFVQKALTRLVGLLCLIVSASIATAQQRDIVNPGFENGPQFPGPGQFFIRPDTSTEGWLSTNGEIEIWNSGHQGIASSSGQYHAELNPNSPIGLYQEVCQRNGENLSWSFDHFARNDGSFNANPQIATFEVVDTGGTLVQTLTTQTTFQGTGWVTNAGTSVYTGPSGVQRIQFRSLNTGAVGNLLDEISVSIVPLGEIGAPSGSDAESSGANMIQVKILGTVVNPVELPFSITGGTAINGVDYTVTSPTISIPAGT